MALQRPIAKSGSALLMSQVGLTVVNFAFTVYLLRVLTKQEFAIIALIDILTAIFGFSEMGLVAVATQQAPSGLRTGKNKAYALVKCALRYQTFALLILGAGTLLLARDVSELFLKTPNFAWAVILIVPSAIASIWFSSLQGIAQICDDFYLSARWNIAAGVTRQVLSILAYFIFGFAGYLIGTIIGLVIPVLGLGWTLRNFLFNDVPAAPFWETFRYGFPFYLRGYLRFGFLQFDQTLVGALLAPEALAGYSVARRFTKYIFIMTESFQTPIGIRMAALRNEPDKVQANFFSKATRYTAFVVIPLSVAVAVASPWLMRLYGGAKYGGDWPLLALLASSQAGYAIYTIFGNAIFARLQPWATLLLDGVTGGVNYLIAPVLIIQFSQYGVAWGQMAGFTAGIACASLLLRNIPEFRFDFRSLRVIGWPLTLACGIMILGQVLYFQWWSVPIYMITAGIAFLWLIGRRFYEDDWNQIRDLMPKSLVPFINKLQKALVSKSV